MSFSPDTSLKLKNYKSFGGEDQGFDRIAPINVIIGRNNSGKSALLDLVAYATAPYGIDHLGHRREVPEVIFGSSVPEPLIGAVFSAGSGGGEIDGNHYEFGRKWIDKPIQVRLHDTNAKSIHKLEPEGDTIPPRHAERVANGITNPFEPYTFRRITAERDIKSEPAEIPTSGNVMSDGNGATNLIQHLLNDSAAIHSLVESNLLDALNKIFEPDSKFERIQIMRHSDGSNRWEVFLTETNKGSIPLSNSGSGLKTVLLVLVNTILIPALDQKNVREYIFGFEELENNLHPGLLRKLLNYLRNLAVENDVTFFITTHSNVVIDLFSGDEQAQLLHVTHDQSEAHVRQMTEYLDNHGVLDDLDIRASDILQSNGVVWVEGPSDRVYINRYIELYTDGKLREGAHYQCVFYGGRLLARTTANPSENQHLNLLKVNRNSSIVIDSDRRTARANLNATKRRLRQEIESVNGYAWITDGKEIENTIPVEALRSYYGDTTMQPVGEFQLYDEYLDGVKTNEGKKFLRNKVLYSENMAQHITKEMVLSNDKLREHTKKLCKKIASWNKLEI